MLPVNGATILVQDYIHVPIAERFARLPIGITILLGGLVFLALNSGIGLGWQKSLSPRSEDVWGIA